MNSNTPVTTLPFVGPRYQQLLQKLGISTLQDLLYHLPSRYIDLSAITPIEQLIEGELQVVNATVHSVKSIRLKGKGKTMVQAEIGDETGHLQATWFNQPYIEKALVRESQYRFAGEVATKFGTRQMTNPTFEPANRPMVHTGRIVPIYPQTAGLTSKWLRARIAPILTKTQQIVPDFLPDEVRQMYDLLPLEHAIAALHAPDSLSQANQAKRRLGFDELFLLQLAALTRKHNRQHGPAAPAMPMEAPSRAAAIKAIPFPLTDAQQRSINEILTDLSRTAPMNRLLEGDVGSGKTVVAMLAALAAVLNGHQVAVMAPTSVLAQQHWRTFQQLCQYFAAAALPSIDVALRTASSKMPPADITIGTHALLSQAVQFSNLGLVIIDEQHRFGVEQRAMLMQKAATGVHLLAMTATPIPRTLALTAHGDLDISIIDQLPADRLPIRTYIVPAAKRADMEEFLSQAMDRGEQVYIICPLIDESDTLTEVRAATAEFERLQQILARHRLALLHGRMTAKQKDTILADFKDHQYDALVATPVVEVGIDVPNATMLVVEGAERFGLAQLHQLRGRVGRGAVQSYCFLLSDSRQANDIARLHHLEHQHSGIALAELDLATRGPGEVYGQRQSGIPELKATSYMDTELTKTARQAAEQIIDRGVPEPIQQQLDRTQRLAEMN